MLGGQMLLAQNDFDQWAVRVNWDGRTPWKYYLNIAPASMGPNALPVPEMQGGKLRPEASATVGGALHRMEGDQTHNVWINGYVPLVRGKVALETIWVPREWYAMSADLRDARRARLAEGTTSGDIYLSLLWQLWQDHNWLPDVLLGINLKTASGGDLRNARYNDAAGYYFDVSAGRSFFLDRKGEGYLRPHLMAGFYVWQIYTYDQQQNDAPLYGVGLDAGWRTWVFHTALAGYSGYIERGDQPLVARCRLRKRWGALGIEAYFQWGLHDFPYTTLRGGLTWYAY